MKNFHKEVVFFLKKGRTAFGVYRFGFDRIGLLLFLVIMLPNFIWFAVPAPNDVLRCESVTPVVDRIASVLQVIMVSALCLVKNDSRQERVKKGIALITAGMFTICHFIYGIVNYLL